MRLIIVVGLTSVCAFGANQDVQLCLAPLEQNARTQYQLSQSDNLSEAIRKDLCREASSNKSSSSFGLSYAEDIFGDPSFGLNTANDSADAREKTCSQDHRNLSTNQALTIFKALHPDKAFESYDHCVSEYFKAKRRSPRVRLDKQDAGAGRVLLSAAWEPDPFLKNIPVVNNFIHDGAACRLKNTVFVKGRRFSEQYARQVSCTRLGGSTMVFSLDTTDGYSEPIVIDPPKETTLTALSVAGSCVRKTEDGKHCAACEFQIGLSLSENQTSQPYVCKNMRAGETVRAQFAGDWAAQEQTQWHLLTYSLGQPNTPCRADNCKSVLQDPIPFWSNNNVHTYATVPDSGEVSFNVTIEKCLRYHKTPVACRTAGLTTLYVAPFYGTKN